MAFTEFYCQTSGSNLNSGSTTTDASTLTYASGTWVNATGVFTPASGNPVTDGVAVGDFASVYPDAETQAVFIGRVTARDATTITVSLTAKSGTAPVDGTTNTTLKIGGAWKGPNGTSGFPWAFVEGTMINASGHVMRVNMKAQTYSKTTITTHSGDNGVIWFQGYTTVPGDGGRAIIDGGTSGASFRLLDISGKSIVLADMTFQNNGASGSADLMNVTGNENIFLRCLYRDCRGTGILVNAVTHFASCEFTACNQSNTSGKGGFQVLTSGSIIYRCFSHHNLGSNSTGGFFDQSMLIYASVFAENGNDGASSGGDVNQTYMNCDFYKNGRHGLNMLAQTAMAFSAINCNFVDNVQYGLQTATTAKNGRVINCGFGAGTMANGSGNINEVTPSLFISGNIDYDDDVTPWVDPDNGDFRINLAAAKNAGLGEYLQIDDAGYAGTVAYPDIGAGHHLDSGGGQSSGVF